MTVILYNGIKNNMKKLEKNFKKKIKAVMARRVVADDKRNRYR
jgi:hypothetical protein